MSYNLTVSAVGDCSDYLGAITVRNDAYNYLWTVSVSLGLSVRIRTGARAQFDEIRIAEAKCCN